METRWLLAISVCTLIAVSVFVEPTRAMNLHRKAFANIGCDPVSYDKSKFARLNRICQECYHIFSDTDIYSNCRSNCFRNEEFVRCTDALLRNQERNHFQSMITELVGNSIDGQQRRQPRDGGDRQE